MRKRSYLEHEKKGQEGERRNKKKKVWVLEQWAKWREMGGTRNKNRHAWGEKPELGELKKSNPPGRKESNQQGGQSPSHNHYKEKVRGQIKKSSLGERKSPGMGRDHILTKKSKQKGGRVQKKN